MLFFPRPIPSGKWCSLHNTFFPPLLTTASPGNPGEFLREKRVEQHLCLAFLYLHVREGIAQLIQAAIAEEQLQKNQRRTTCICIVLVGRRPPWLNVRDVPLVKDHMHAATIEVKREFACIGCRCGV